MRKYSNNNNKDMSHADMINYMKEYSWRKYRIEPYLATVCLRATHALGHLATGSDSMTGYGFLPDFTESMRRPIQNSSPVVVGWDASPRGSISEGKHFRDIQGMHPFTPITASNEITEGIALLSKILPDGSVDNSYLAKIRELRDEYGF